jgi:hypothetical protein
MKMRISRKSTLWLTLLILPCCGCLQQVSSLPEQTTLAAAPEPTLETAVETASDTNSAEAVPEDDISNAPFKPVSGELVVPPGVTPSPAVAEVIKLANSGSEEEVILAFVSNSAGTFNLRAEEIIYLNDIGLPSAVVRAMLQRDHMLQAEASASQQVQLWQQQAAQAAAPEPGPGSYAPTEPLQSPGTPPTEFDTAETEPVPPEQIAAPDFNDALAPYGTWVDVEGYGRCWQPTAVVVNAGWQPYFDRGHWVYSDCGWYWMSDYSWGWAPFHYGRWFRHASLGWCWEPDHVWAPSWVCWRTHHDYCGWAPLPPGAVFSAALGLTFHGHHADQHHHFGVAAGSFRFVPASHFRDHQLRGQAAPPAQAAGIFAASVPSTRFTLNHNYIINEGLSRSEIAAATHTEIRPVALRELHRAPDPGIRERLDPNGRTLVVYRPYSEQTGSGSRAAGAQARPPAAAANQSLAAFQTGGARETSAGQALNSNSRQGHDTLNQPRTSPTHYSASINPAQFRETQPAALEARARGENTTGNPRTQVRPAPNAPLILHGPQYPNRAINARSAAHDFSNDRFRQNPPFVPAPADWWARPIPPLPHPDSQPTASRPQEHPGFLSAFENHPPAQHQNQAPGPSYAPEPAHAAEHTAPAPAAQSHESSHAAAASPSSASSSDKHSR